MADFGQQQWGKTPLIDNQWDAQQQERLGVNQWDGWSQQQIPNMNAFGMQHYSNTPMGNQNDSWAGQNQAGVSHWNPQNQWNQAGYWGNQAPASNIGAWASHPESQWDRQNLAGPAGFSRTVPSTAASTATAISTPSNSNLILGNGTSGDLREHASWPSSSYQLDAPQFAGMGR